VSSLVKRVGAVLEAFSSRASYFSVLILLIGAVLHYTGIDPAPQLKVKMTVFICLLVISLLFSLGLLVGLLVPQVRMWPPPEKNSWQFYYVWILYTIGALGAPVIGILDWGSLGLRHIAVPVIGAVALLTAVPLGEWGVRTLNVHQTLGLTGTMLTTGPYRYTRNPQYVAEILIYLGIVLVTGSLLALIVAAAMVSWFVMAPFAEEPWLARQFGRAYDEYRKKVPRFIGVRSIFHVKSSH
jgi:protein-S-isoprenylcysteine O-methyltransferase Ste14